MPALPFPRSSTPGKLAGEGEGRLINVQVEKQGDTFLYRRAPGLNLFSNSVGDSGVRGMYYGSEANTAVVVFNNFVRLINGTTGIVGSPAIPNLGGSDQVTIARNNRTSGGTLQPDYVITRSAGTTAAITGSGVVTYPDADLPITATSVAFLDAFFVWTVPDGRIFASEANSTTINALSYATAESAADGLIRGFVYGGRFYACGSATIEVWRNAGLTPFPLARDTSVIPIGLFTFGAIAGGEDGWNHPPLFVASDGTVRILNGYQTEIVSTPDVQRFVFASTASTMRAFVYTHGGHSIWVLTSDVGTWEYDVTLGSWRERVSSGMSRWRGMMSCRIGPNWLIGDATTGKLFFVTDNSRAEDGTVITSTIESAPLKDYPARASIGPLFADITLGNEKSGGGAASVNVYFSLDGGGAWLGPYNRSLGASGRRTVPVRVNRLGKTTAAGLRARFVISDDVDFAFLGASVPSVSGRKP